jgi:phosphoribosylpyrophosphate synthetase
MEEIKRENIEFMKRLDRHPHLKARMEALLNIAEASVESGEMTADEVEIQLREKVREMGQNTLQDWAESKEKQATLKASENHSLKRHGKKNFIGTQHSEK